MQKLFKIFFNEFKKNKIFYFLNNFLFKLLNLSLTLIIINKTSEISYGQYVYFISLISIFLTLSCMGVTLLLTKDISAARDKISRHNHISSFLIFSFMFPIILELMLLLLFFIIINPDTIKDFKLYFLFYLTQSIILNILVSFNVAVDKQVRSQLTETFIRLPFMILLFLSIEYLSINFLLFSLNIGLFLSIAFLFYLSFSELKIFFKNFFYFSIKLINFKQIFILGITTIIYGLYSRTDILMLEYLVGLPQVSIYNLAFIIGHIPLLIITSLNPFIQTVVSKNNSIKKFKDTKKILLFSRFSMAIFSILFLLFYIFFFKKLISIFIPSFYQESLSISIYLLIYFIIISPFYFSEIILTMTENVDFILKCYLFAFIINIIFNYFLIPQYQAKGAIIATVLSLFIANIAMFYKSRLTINK
jgi:O-antigen/teichoic acid export membrane protein